MATRVGRGKIQLAAFDSPFPKNLADVSYTSRVIANFVPNSVAMATREADLENHTLGTKITTLNYHTFRCVQDKVF